MYVIEKLRLNGFKDVFIPTAKQLYEKLGFSNPRNVGNVDKDGNFAEPVNLQNNADKLTAISLGARLIRQEYEQTQRKANEDARENQDRTNEPAEKDANSD